MRRSDREKVSAPRLDHWDAVAIQYGVANQGDVLYRSLFTVRGAHDGVMAHLRERAELPTEVPRG